ncbi:MAG: aminoacyl--tRNA ligase-related protein [Promethearchaeota archaeon]
MRFEADVFFELSKKLPADAEKSLKEFFNNANKDFLKKGAPEGKENEGTTIEEYRIMPKDIFLSLNSGRYVRVHTGIMRLNNELSKFLGKKYHLGVRSINVKRFEIDMELEQKPIEPIKLPFTKNIDFDRSKAHIVLDPKDLDETALKKNYIDKLLNRLNDKIRAQNLAAGKAAFSETVKRSEKRLDKYVIKEDPTEEALRRGWVKEFPGAGVWTIMPPFTALIRAIEQLVIDKIIKPMGFVETIFPRLIPLEVERKKGHLAIPNELFWVCPPTSRNPKDFEQYVDYVEITGDPAPDQLQAMLRPPMFGLAYAQCEPFYQIFEKEIVDIDDLEMNPILFFDRNGPTWRWEGGGLKGLERLNEFHRIEFTYMSTPKKTIEIRDEILKRSEEIIDSIFDMEYRIDKTTAVYLEHAGVAEQEEAEEFVKTYDLTAILPFETSSRPEAELEISSYHVHTDFYAERFNFKDKAGKDVWTGCVGIGPSRWAYVFVIRHGFKFENWPQEIKKYVGAELPKTPQLVTWPKK